MQIDFINGHDEFNGHLWFFDGNYIGHDDQIDVTDFVTEGHARTSISGTGPSALAPTSTR